MEFADGGSYWGEFKDDKKEGEGRECSTPRTRLTLFSQLSSFTLGKINYSIWKIYNLIKINNLKYP